MKWYILYIVYSTHLSTTLHLNGEQQTSIEITSGIRQGCNGSTMLFTLITYQIIEALQQQIQGFTNEKFHIPVIF